MHVLSFGLNYIIDYSTSPFRNDTIMLTVSYLISAFAFMSSMGFVSLSSLERYLAICHPIKHHVLKGTKRTYRLIGIVVLISVGYTCVVSSRFIAQKESITCILWPDENIFAEYPKYMRGYRSSYSPQIRLFFSILSQLVSLLVWLSGSVLTCYMYVRIVRTMMIRAENKQLNTSNGFEKQLRQVAVMVIANGTFFFLCSSLQIISQIISILMGNGIEIFTDESTYYIWVHIRVLSIGVNSSINPLIYFTTNQRYRKAFTSVFHIDCGSAVENRQKEYNPPRPGENTSTL